MRCRSGKARWKTKKKCRRRPAAAAPPSRPEQVKQVGLLAELAGIGAASRARVTTARLVNAYSPAHRWIARRTSLGRALRDVVLDRENIAMARMTFADYPAGGDVEGGEQGSGALWVA